MTSLRLTVMMIVKYTYELSDAQSVSKLQTPNSKALFTNKGGSRRKKKVVNAKKEKEREIEKKKRKKLKNLRPHLGY